MKEGINVLNRWCGGLFGDRSTSRSVGFLFCYVMRFGSVDEILECTLARNPRCSRRRRIDKADISTFVAVDQRAANCLEEAVRSFTTMWSKFRSSHADVTFRHPLPVFRVVWCSPVHCLQTCVTVELFRCTRAPIA
ncbi:uncharacterized protein TNCV_736631 [Trichonephila clavipes]|nr:uncharacterized protein TNCV_736631 [Trichonephila clavipes]